MTPRKTITDLFWRIAPNSMRLEVDRSFSFESDLSSITPFLLQDLFAYTHLSDQVKFSYKMRSGRKFVNEATPISDRVIFPEGFDHNQCSGSEFAAYRERQMAQRLSAMTAVDKYLDAINPQGYARVIKVDQNKLMLQSDIEYLLNDFVTYFDLENQVYLHGGQARFSSSYATQAFLLCEPAHLLDRLVSHPAKEGFEGYFISQVRARMQKHYEEMVQNHWPARLSAMEEGRAIQEEITALLSFNHFNEAVSLTYRQIDDLIERGKRKVYPTLSNYTRLVTDHNTPIGVCELRGHRDTQEDCLQTAVREVADFAHLLAEAQDAVLKNTFSQLQRDFGQRPMVGSTCCSMIAWMKQNELYISTANLGDSFAMMIVIDVEQFDIVNAVQINSLHNPDQWINESEYRRACEVSRQNNKEIPLDGRLQSDSGLAISRSFGDCASEPFGMSHQPDIYHLRRMLKPSEKAYVLVACDGLTERGALSIAKIARIVFQFHRLPLDTIAYTLAENAMRISNDNISVALTQVTETPVSLTVLDGHGGDIVAREVGEHYYAVLQHHVHLALRPETISRPSATPQALFAPAAPTPVSAVREAVLLVPPLGKLSSLSRQ